MTARIAFYLALLLLIPVIDTALFLFYRRKLGPRRTFDRRSLFIMSLLIVAGLACAAYLSAYEIGRVPANSQIMLVASVIMMLVGILIRCIAIVTLGRFFSVHVEISESQILVTTGIYHYLRHPAYAGILLVFIGVGLAFQNWLSVISAAAFTIAGIAYRVRVEEAALSRHFGLCYASYAERTKRFVPFLI